MGSWSKELFTVGEANPFDPPVYRLIDDAGTILDGIVSQDKLSRGSCTATSEEGEARRPTNEMEWLPSFIQHLDRRQGGRGLQTVIAA